MISFFIRDTVQIQCVGFNIPLENTTNIDKSVFAITFKLFEK